MSGFAADRLTEERKMWRREHPAGFQARLTKRSDNSTDIMRWECIVPGKAGTEWEEGYYPCTLQFSEDYPSRAPIVTFMPSADGAVIWHPNIFSTGRVCLNILNEMWTPGITIKDILIGLQMLLGEPNAQHVTDRTEPSAQYRNQREEYDKRVRTQFDYVHK